MDASVSAASGEAYVDLKERSARIDARQTRDRLALEQASPWAALDGAGLYFGPEFLARFGIDAAALAGDPEGHALLDWALALSTCHAFQLLEELILRFAAAEEARLGPTRSVTLLVEEEA